ncbi:mitochondrial cytochrome c oxidase protein 20-like protein [Zalerion maritima]|uniref:Cytochrome c oxidase assembly protein COX20, mitochondrial n=1 Tax=Zalerion maritima TaxID=339359 RepID=A0AAD5RNG1_9PEZI|nr:mitochondrial cytochrome c oxidase protein 20-like protein [Zalerion maritima]
MSSESGDGPSTGLGGSSSSNSTPGPRGLPQQIPDGGTKGKTIYATFSDIPKDRQPEQQKPAKYADLADKLDFQGLLKVHERPCGREGLLTGIGGGAAMGAIRFVFGTSVPKAANWAVGTFLLGSIASFEYCKFNRRQEHGRVKRLLKVYNAELKKKQEEEEASKRKAEEERRMEEVKTKQWYRFW